MKLTLIAIIVLSLVLPSAAQSIKPDMLKHSRDVPGIVGLAFNRLVAGDLNSEENEIEQLAKTPGINAALVELLHAAYHGSQEHQLMRSVFAVLELRADLGEEDQQWLRTELKAIWNQRDGTKSVTMKECAMKLLAKYPGAANEDIMLLYLTEPESGEVLGCAYAGLFGLETIGTVRALDGLNAYLQKLPSENAFDATRRNRVSKLIDLITAKTSRNKEASNPSAPSSAQTEAQTARAKTKSPDASMPTSDNELDGSTQWSMIVTLIAAVRSPETLETRP